MATKYYWLDNDAKLIEVGFAQHNDYATELYQKEFGIDKFHDFICNQKKYPYQWLHEKGWVRITASENRVEILGDCIDLTKPQRNTIDPKMNVKQLEVAKNLCKEYNYPFYKAINDKRFH
jgi:hypothetical protein